MSKWPENFMTCSPREILNALNAAAAERNISNTHQLEKGTKINRIAWSNGREDLGSLRLFTGWGWIHWYQTTFLKPATTLNDAVDYRWADASKIEKEEWLIDQIGAYPLEYDGQNRPSFGVSSSGIRKNDLRWAEYVKRAYNLTFKSTAGIWIQGEVFRIHSDIASITGNVAFRYQDKNYVDHDETLTNVIFDEYGDAFTTIAPATSRIRAAYGLVDYSCPGGFEYLDIDNQSNK